jgi:hypothetical protein
MPDILESLVSNSPGLLRAAVIGGYVLNDFLPRPCFGRAPTRSCPIRLKTRDYESPTRYVKTLRTVPSAQQGIGRMYCGNRIVRSRHYCRNLTCYCQLRSGIVLSRVLRERVNRLPFLCGKIYFPRRHVFFQVGER